MTNNKQNLRASSSTGHDFSESAHLDRHFLACQPEYEAMLKSVGLKKGWHVLDAGCGAGSFLPLMSQLVGASGEIQALDLAPENVALVKARQTNNEYACCVTARVGDVTKLPYADNSFDAVWCAAISQYLDDDALNVMLGEFKRVLKPGGVMGLKDVHLNTWEWQPLDPLLPSRLWSAAMVNGSPRTWQGLRGVVLPAIVRRVGFKHLRANTVMIQRWQPLSDAERSYQSHFLPAAAALAHSYENLSDADKAVWEKVGDVTAPNHMLNHPDFYFCEGHMMIVAENC
ncbi:MAG: methyltransferase domain-containing protein [Chloroflexota bacterium]